MKISYSVIILCFLSLGLSMTSCFHRELDSDENYINLKKDKSIKDNEILRFRTFRIKANDGFLIFGNNNEVSLEGKAQIPIYLFIDKGNKQAIIDLTGCIYEYEEKTENLLFRDVTIRSTVLDQPILVDMLFGLSKSPPAGGSELFNLKLKQFSLSDDQAFMVGEKATIDGHVIAFMSEFNYQLVYYRN